MKEKLKICMLGATGVGKTSLVERFVTSIFSETYRTTVGVKIQSREMRRGGAVLDLVLWDLSGEDEFETVRLAYLRGAAGYLLVVDGTRRETLETAISLQKAARGAIGYVPFVTVLNKGDLSDSWSLEEKDLRMLAEKGFSVVRTSAKTGDGVEEAFTMLVEAIAKGGRS